MGTERPLQPVFLSPGCWGQAGYLRAVARSCGFSGALGLLLAASSSAPSQHTRHTQPVSSCQGEATLLPLPSHLFTSANCFKPHFLHQPLLFFKAGVQRPDHERAGHKTASSTGRGFQEQVLEDTDATWAEQGRAGAHLHLMSR